MLFINEHRQGPGRATDFHEPVAEPIGQGYVSFRVGALHHQRVVENAHVGSIGKPVISG